MKTTFSYPNGKLTLNGKSITVLTWQLSIERSVPRKVKSFEWKIGRKGVFIDIDGMPTVMLRPLATASGSAVVLQKPMLGKTYDAVFNVPKKKLKILAKIWVTEVNTISDCAGNPKISIKFIIPEKINFRNDKPKKGKRRC